MTKDIFHRNKNSNNNNNLVNAKMRMRAIKKKHQQNKKGRKIAVLANPPPGFGREGKWGPKKLVYKGKERPQTKAARAGTSLQAQKDEEEYGEPDAGVPLEEVPYAAGNIAIPPGGENPVSGIDQMLQQGVA